MTRDRYVVGQAPDWRMAKPGHKAQARRLPKSVRKALRDYRRKGDPDGGRAALTGGFVAVSRLRVGDRLRPVAGAGVGWLP